jgi:ubiquinol-cytochrome c reductase cytochrome b/c1 subunit
MYSSEEDLIYLSILPYYAILRSIPHKVGGVIAMGGALIVLLLLPFINTSEIRSSTFRPLFKQFF